MLGLCDACDLYTHLLRSSLDSVKIIDLQRYLQSQEIFFREGHWRIQERGLGRAPPLGPTSFILMQLVPPGK